MRPARPDSLPPGPSLSAPLQLARYALDPLGALRRWSKRYGDTFLANFAGLGRFVFTSSPEHIRAIFTADPEAFDASAQNAGIWPLVGRSSLLTLVGFTLVRHRRMC